MPSMNETWGTPGQTLEAFKAGTPANRSHYWIKGGTIEYLPDCTHGHAGKTYDLLPFSDVEIRYAASRNAP